MNKKANLSSLSTQTTLTIFIGLVKKTNKSSKVPLLHVVNLEHAFLRQQDEKIVDTKWYLPNSCPCFLSTTSVVVTISTASHPHTSSEAASISLNPRTITAKTTSKNVRTTILVFYRMTSYKTTGVTQSVILFPTPQRSSLVPAFCCDVTAAVAGKFQLPRSKMGQRYFCACVALCLTP